MHRLVTAPVRGGGGMLQPPRPWLPHGGSRTWGSGLRRLRRQLAVPMGDLAACRSLLPLVRRLRCTRRL
eukprot:13763628-Alexandrium_andersonii.AAC.1